MKVILLRDIKGVGRRYEEKSVADGFALNKLIPQKLAVPATGAAAAQIKNLKENDKKHHEAEDRKLSEEVHKIAGTTITISREANEQGHLFAALTREKISNILRDKGINLPTECIALEQGIKDAGTHTIPVHIGGKETRFTLVIESK